MYNYTFWLFYYLRIITYNYQPCPWAMPYPEPVIVMSTLVATLSRFRLIIYGHCNRKKNRKYADRSEIPVDDNAERNLVQCPPSDGPYPKRKVKGSKCKTAETACWAVSKASGWTQWLLIMFRRNLSTRTPKSIGWTR